MPPHRPRTTCAEATHAAAAGAPKPSQVGRHRPVVALGMGMVLLALIGWAPSQRDPHTPAAPYATRRGTSLQASASRAQPRWAAAVGDRALHHGSPAGAGWRGYWLVTRDGRVVSHRAPAFGSVVSLPTSTVHALPTGLPPTQPIVALAPTADDQGYWEVTATGTVTNFGDALFAGGARVTATTPTDPVVGIAADDATGGFWLATRSGRVIPYRAPSFGAVAPPAAHGRRGSPPTTHPAGLTTAGLHRRAVATASQAVVSIAATPDDQGYWEVTAGGNVISFGDAVVTSTTGDASASNPVVGIATDDATGGFWLVTRDGQVLPHHAPYLGATVDPGAQRSAPRAGGAAGSAGTATKSWRSAVVALTPTANDQGYWEVTAAGVVTAFGDAATVAASPVASHPGSTRAASARAATIAHDATASSASTVVTGLGASGAVVGIAADDWAPPVTSGAGPGPGVGALPKLTVTTTALTPARQGTEYQARLGTSGGTATRRWAVASGWIPPGLALSPDGVLSGTPTAPGTYDFTVTVADGRMLGGQAATAHLSLTVDPPVAPSSRWAGYTESGTAFSMVSGTFDVPDLVASPGATSTSEWVGIDGATNGALIQAGVEQSFDPATGGVSMYPWWEILPAPETRIPMRVHPGDRIEVTISAAGGDLWTIAMTDHSTGQRFSTRQVYTGPDTSAEWIVEAPTRARSGIIEPLGAFAPDVAFSALDYTGAVRSLTEWAIVQNGVTMAMPSPLTPLGFTVAPGGSPPPAP